MFPISPVQVFQGEIDSPNQGESSSAGKARAGSSSSSSLSDSDEDEMLRQIMDLESREEGQRGLAPSVVGLPSALDSDQDTQVISSALLAHTFCLIWTKSSFWSRNGPPFELRPRKVWFGWFGLVCFSYLF